MSGVLTYLEPPHPCCLGLGLQGCALSLHEQAAQGDGMGEDGPETDLPLVVLSPEASGSFMAAPHSCLLWTVLHKACSPDKQPYNKGNLLRMQIPGYPPAPNLLN